MRLRGFSCGAAFLLGIFFLRDSSALQIEQSIHGTLAVPQDAAQFPPPPVSGAENFTERDGLTREFRAYGAAQELVFVEDTDLCHVPRIKPQRDVSPTYAANVVEM